ncbi:MAG: WecB/TagA/CpsF family glycosyltransferase [Microbacterium gubbeenense]|uniref:WecB/TagA/CpsF family glycosyltransferase n=1 Tax=Microbacterium gubbeenense TaxID=159896 RepID=UPI003F9A2E23
MGSGSSDSAPRVKVGIDLATGTASILDRPLFAGDQEALLTVLMARAEATQRPELIITPNVDQVVRLAEDHKWRDAYERATMHIVDGMPVLVLARLLGATDLHRHTGADLLPSATARAALKGLRVAIIGGRNDARNKAVDRLREQNSGLEISGFEIPMLDDVHDDVCRDVVSQLRDFRPAIAFICLGSPKQELWFYAWENELPTAVYIGAGAAVDFAAGDARRAPGWVQRAGIEWLWRLAQEPRRLAHRYLVRGPRFLVVVARSVFSARRRRG